MSLLRTGSLREEFPYRRIWGVAWPIIIGSAAQTLMNVINTAFISRLGEVALGAGAIAGLIYLTVIMFAWGFGVGSQIVVARRYGEGRLRLMGRTVTHAFLFQWAMALVLFLVLFFGRDVLLNLVVRSEGIRALGEEFLRYRLWGLFFAHTNFAFRSFYVGMARTKVITLTTVVMVLVNIVFDYLLIFGNFGFPELGVSGAALASVLAEVTCSVTFLVYTLTRLEWRRYRMFSFRVLSGRLLVRLLRTALPVMVQNFVTMFAWLAFFLIIEKLGEAELAVSNIVRSVYLILQIPIMGFSSATNTFISYLMGQGRWYDVTSLLGRTLRFCLALVGGLAVVTALLHDPILRIYTQDAHHLELAYPVYMIICTASVLQASAAVLFSAITGTGRTRVGLGVDLIALVVYLSLAWVLGVLPGATLTRVWYVEWVYGLTLSTISLLYLRFGRWQDARV